MEGKIVSINISGKKGVVKKPVKSALLKKDSGISGDAHSGKRGSPGGLRQVSLLGKESVEKWLCSRRISGKMAKIKPGDFAENITTGGIDWKKIKKGNFIRLGSHAIIEITQIGKTCHTGCAIRNITGDCIMPRQGVFARVIRGGKISKGDTIKIGTLSRLND